jgi:penicillin-binding protein 2
LQMANAICLIANKGWYYVPHFVKSIEGETKEDTLLNKYRTKISPLHIPDTAYQAVIDGMEMVVTNGTARNAKIDGFNVCAKTGTVENYFRKVKQKDHSFFVAFAPKENPRIAICVVVENGGFGATWAAPIASLLMEKFLTDSIAGDKRKAEVERIANASIIPARIKYERFKRDSIKQVKDSLLRIRLEREQQARIDSANTVMLNMDEEIETLPVRLPADEKKQTKTQTLFLVDTRRHQIYSPKQNNAA